MERLTRAPAVLLGSFTAGDQREICEDYAGHEWFPAGGGMLICGRCEAEAWEDEVSEEARP